jgi:hypothetical protein
MIKYCRKKLLSKTSYKIDKVSAKQDMNTNIKNLTATAGVSGFANFFPKTALGWLIVLIMILVIVLIVRKLRQDNKRQKSLQEVNANHIDNLPF